MLALFNHLLCVLVQLRKFLSHQCDKIRSLHLYVEGYIHFMQLICE